MRSRDARHRTAGSGRDLIEPLAEVRGRVSFGLVGSELGETSYPVCGTSAASAYSPGKNAGGTDDVSQRDTFHMLGSLASGASALAGRGSYAGIWVTR